MILDLTRRYGEPHRRYHVLTHPAKMLEIGMEHFDLTNEQVLAIWYHDAIYVSGATDNEARSAELFENDYFDNEEECYLLSNRVEIEGNTVKQIILDTKTHVPSIKESEAVIDLDLMGLGSRFEEYWQNARDVRFEFQGFGDVEWKEGRAKFLQKMLDREQIFYTEFGKRLESDARKNMSYELNLLKVGNPRY